jgi:ABC-type sulfate transport system permease component
VSRRAFWHSALQVRTTGRKSYERDTHQHSHLAVVLNVAVGAIVAWVVMQVHYRKLFDELLEVKPTSTAHTSAAPVSVHS